MSEYLNRIFTSKYERSNKLQVVKIKGKENKNL